MDDSDLLAFTPVPLRARRDGWTPKKQYFFILGLARGFGPEKAARILGMSRKSAYALRARPGAEGFAAAWDAAVARARDRRFDARGPSLAERGLQGEWHPRLYRGRLVGWTHRPANARLMGALKRLDRQAERLPPGTDPANLDRFLDPAAAEGHNPDANPRIRRQSCYLPPRHGGLGKAGP
jgi:hypothetical protein